MRQIFNKIYEKCIEVLVYIAMIMTLVAVPLIPITIIAGCVKLLIIMFGG